MGTLKDDMKESVQSIKNTTEIAGVKAKFAAKVTSSIATEGAKEMMSAAKDIGKETMKAAKDVKDSISDRINSNLE